MPAGRPRRDVIVPASVEAVAGGEVVVPVWENELGGFTFAVGDPLARYVKWSPPRSPLNLGTEASRLGWAGRFVNVPEVLSFDRNEDGSTLVTAALAGENAVSPRWRAHPSAAVAAIGRGLRHLHDTLPLEECPFYVGRGGPVGVHQRAGHRGPARSCVLESGLRPHEFGRSVGSLE